MTEVKYVPPVILYLILGIGIAYMVYAIITIIRQYSQSIKVYGTISDIVNLENSQTIFVDYAIGKLEFNHIPIEGLVTGLVTQKKIGDKVKLYIDPNTLESAQTGKQIIIVICMCIIGIILFSTVVLSV